MTANGNGTKMQQNVDKPEAIEPESQQCAGENGVHIAGEHGSDLGSNTKKINGQAPENTGSDGANVPGAISSVGRAGASHASSREFESLIAHQSKPTYRRFKDINSSEFAVYFWSRVAVGPPDQCWLWGGSKNRDGYGQLKAGGRYFVASRMAYRLATGSDPAGILVCHTCDNPPCCNPAHLYAGSSRDNVADMVDRGRLVSVCGEQNHFAKLDDAKVRNIRVLIDRGFKNTEIGKAVGVHHSTVSMIRTGKTWKHVA